MDSNASLWLATTFLVLASLIISVIDARRLIIPNAWNATYAGGGFIFADPLGNMSFLTSIIGGVLGFTTILILRVGYRIARGREGIGFGDVKFMAGAGLWVGWYGLAPLLLVSSLSALLFVLFHRLISDHFDPQREIPFGPFLCIGTLTVWTIQTAGLAPWIIP